MTTAVSVCFLMACSREVRGYGFGQCTGVSFIERSKRECWVTYIWQSRVIEGPCDGPTPCFTLYELGDGIIVDLRFYQQACRALHCARSPSGPAETQQCPPLMTFSPALLCTICRVRFMRVCHRIGDDTSNIPTASPQLKALFHHSSYKRGLTPRGDHFSISASTNSIWTELLRFC